MLKKILKYSIIAILLANTNAYALNPISMLEDGKKAFELSKWEESREILEHFMETWPEHEKYNEALYFYTIASAKTIDSRTELYRKKLGLELNDAIENLSKNNKNLDIEEAKAALKLAQSHDIKPEIWENLTDLNPNELKHFISRNWYPEPTNSPFSTLKWANSWLATHKTIDSDLKSDIALIKLAAMWKIITSPMVKNSSEKELEELGCLPLDKAFRTTLHEAFNNGNLDNKRKAAVFGYHFDFFNTNKLNTNKKINSRWLRYLKSRGVAPNEAWSPK